MNVTATIKKAAVFTIICLLCSNASAAMYSMSPSDPDLGDLDHSKNYTWGINTPWDVTPDENFQYERVASATLSFDSIRNWDSSPNVLYVHLLDHALLGVDVDHDGQGGGDEFDGMGVELITYHDLPATSQDLSYSFNEDEIAALNTYAADGRFGLGFDPDCHFYNSGVTLKVETVPEPVTLVLMAAGLPILLRRRQRNKRMSVVRNQ